MFCGAYVGGIVYDAMHSYARMFYAGFAISIAGVFASLIAKDISLRKYYRPQTEEK
jgi:predicted MFS family arabinose efflux permease